MIGYKAKILGNQKLMTGFEKTVEDVEKYLKAFEANGVVFEKVEYFDAGSK